MRITLVHFVVLWRRGRAILAGLLAVTLAALLLCVTAALAADSLLAEGRGFVGLTLVVSQDEDEAVMDELLGYLASTGQVDAWASMAFAASEEEARAMVTDGRASGALLFPAGFLQSLMSGENLPPTLVLNSATPLEALVLLAAADSVTAMLAAAQGGVQAVAGALPGMAGQGAVSSLNLRYLGWVLQRDIQFLPARQVSASGSLPLVSHYLLSLATLLLMLCAPFMHRLLNGRGTSAWAGRLRALGQKPGPLLAARLLFAVLAMQIALLVLAGGFALLGSRLGLSARLSPGLVAGLVVAGVWLGCFACLVCSLGGIQAAGGTAVLAALVLGYIGGGLLPPVLLPAAVRDLVSNSPVGWLRAALAPLWGTAFLPGALAGLLASALCMALLFCLLAARGMRR